MPKTYDPLQPLPSLQGPPPLLFTALALSMLLPVLEDGDAFEDAFELLFGDGTTATREKRRLLRKELGKLTRDSLPHSLPALIQNNLLPKVKAYYEKVPREECKREEANEFQDLQDELGALSAITKLSIRLHEDLPILLGQKPLTPYPTEQSIHLLYSKGQVQALLDLAFLSPALLNQLFPLHHLIARVEPSNPEQKHDFALEGMIWKALEKIPIKLGALSKKNPEFQGLLSEPTVLLPSERLADPARDYALQTLHLRSDDTEKSIQAAKLQLQEIPFQEGVFSAEALELRLRAQDTQDYNVWNGPIISEFIELFSQSRVVGGIALFLILPVSPLVVFLDLGLHYGQKHARFYEEALVEVNNLLRDGHYVQAASLLDQQLDAGRMIQWMRAAFLTSEHYVAGHFFSAICAENSSDFSKAYKEYERSQIGARKANKPLIVFLANLHKLALLKKATQEQLALSINKEVMADKTLLELTQEYEAGFIDLYCKIHALLLKLTTLFANRYSFSAHEIKIVNDFLLFEGFFLLKHLSQGQGEFLGIFAVFFQGVILAFFHQYQPDYLLEESLTALKPLLLLPLPPKDPQKKQEILLALALEKMQRALCSLVSFKKTQGMAVQRNPEIQSSMAFIEQFILFFHAYCAEKGGFFKKAYNRVTKKLEIPPELAKKIQQEKQSSNEWLRTLYRDFGLRFLSIEAWMNDLSPPNSEQRSMVSVKTGDNLLHVLTSLPFIEEIKKEKLHPIVSALKEQRFQRNHLHQTPLFCLSSTDPYQLKSLLELNGFVKVGDQLEQVDLFLKQQNKSKHFLLLEGPPGTGKTETVLQHLKTQGHVIYEWVAGAANDQFLGQLLKRVISFFEEAKKAAQRDPHTMHLLFMDEIDAVCPESSGPAKNGFHNRQEVVTEFQRQVNKLKDTTNLLLIGASNFPENIALAMLSRAIRINFDLPNSADRKKLLEHFFEEKTLDPLWISRLVELTPGWSIRDLLFLVRSIEKKKIDLEDLKQVFTRNTDLIEKDFRKQFPHAHLMLPVFDLGQKEDPLDALSVLSDQTKDYFLSLSASLLHPEDFNGKCLHTLLYGPPGGGKTTTVRTFAKNCNAAFLLIEAGVTPSELAGVFNRAKTFKPAIIFIDEIDKLAYDGGPFREFLQEQMEGFLKNALVIIGATNYRERIAEPLLSRFVFKLFVPPFTAEQRGLLLKKTLEEKFLQNLKFQMDESLALELEKSCPTLGKVSEGLSLRDIDNQLTVFFGNLRTKQRKLQPDSCITLDTLVKLLQPQPAPAGAAPERHRNAFFQGIPEELQELLGSQPQFHG